MYLVILILLIVLLIAALPGWPYMAPIHVGYWPSGVVLLIVIVLIVLLATGRL